MLHYRGKNQGQFPSLSLCFTKITLSLMLNDPLSFFFVLVRYIDVFKWLVLSTENVKAQNHCYIYNANIKFIIIYLS